MKKTIAVGIVLYKEKSVLLVKHTEKARLLTGIYNFPAGRVEEGETLEVNGHTLKLEYVGEDEAFVSFDGSFHLFCLFCLITKYKSTFST